jgi:hypothetical protein
MFDKTEMVIIPFFVLENGVFFRAKTANTSIWLIKKSSSGFCFAVYAEAYLSQPLEPDTLVAAFKKDIPLSFHKFILNIFYV